jgi:hypothetical protein
LYSPPAKKLVIELIAKANVPKLEIISTDVKIIPELDSGCTTPNPTVEIVIMVMKKESIKFQPSINMNPKVPAEITVNNRKTKKDIRLNNFDFNIITIPKWIFFFLVET